MKRVGGLCERIVTRDNLLLAFCKARRGHRASVAVQAFGADLERNLATLRDGIRRGDVPVGDCQRFEIRDPKPRTIHAPVFRERVLHHAIMNICEPRLDRYLIDDTFACRPGRGTSAAITRAQQFARQHRWVLKLDIARYFDSIDHELLKVLLARLFKDRALLALLDRILDSHHVTPGKGLPIGTLTSQHFANLYLGKLDHHIKNDLRCAGYVRYMDDFLLFDDDRERLRGWLRALHVWLAEQLRLRIKPSIQLLPTGRGVPFLGMRVMPTHVMLTGMRKRRFARAVRGCAEAFLRGGLAEAVYGERLTALFSHAERARSRGFRRSLLQQLERDGLPVME